MVDTIFTPSISLPSSVSFNNDHGAISIEFCDQSPTTTELEDLITLINESKRIHEISIFITGRAIVPADFFCEVMDALQERDCDMRFVHSDSVMGLSEGKMAFTHTVGAENLEPATEEQFREAIESLTDHLLPLLHNFKRIRVQMGRKCKTPTEISSPPFIKFFDIHEAIKNKNAALAWFGSAFILNGIQECLPSYIVTAPKRS